MSTQAKTHAREVASGERFAFGGNWARFLELLDEQRIRQAEESLRTFLEMERLDGRSFIDIGCGSGIFSLAARRLGARVHSFDYDPDSARCAREVRRRYFPEDSSWTIEEGSVLDQAYLSRLGRFDIVYSWGVLHHTGEMWRALDNVAPLVTPGGKLFISIYNDQGSDSKRWRAVKKAYNRLPAGLRWVVLWPCAFHVWWRPVLKDLILLRPFRQWRAYRQERGMSPWRDLVDWVGGFPFEVAKPEQVFDFYRAREFRLTRLSTCGGSLGCNQFVFEREK